MTCVTIKFCRIEVMECLLRKSDDLPAACRTIIRKERHEQVTVMQCTYNLYYMYVYEWVRVCVCVWVRACVRARVCVCVITLIQSTHKGSSLLLTWQANN